MLLLALFLGLTTAGTRPAGSSLVPLASHRRADDALAARLHSIEGAFRQGDAAALRASFSAAGKVRVELHDLPQGEGSYAAGQLQVIFGRLFEESPTRSFEFARDEVRLAQGTAFARGRWVRRQARSEENVETLTFTLRDESGDWRILEIRSSR